MRLILTFLLFTTVFIPVFSQTPISGIINIYAAATAYDECSNELSLSSTSGFEADMKIIIIQMQGALINTANNSSFGNITSMGQAGKYETAEILSVNANGMVLKKFPVNTYDYNGKVQVVSMPVYESAIVEAKLTAAPWDGQTGGVLALEVTGQLIADADIDVSGKGFRGGLSSVNGNNSCSFLTNANDYSYDQGNWRGAPKGEGIAIINNGKENGRGAQANGGGGGNDHNAGGGGGSNISAGGNGGNNEEPSTFGCDGNFPGKGGKTITAVSDRIFMGGGGGAGHENNGVGTDGGNGGGIVFIIANDFAGLGFSVKANGADAATAAGDGAGGGGGGGTIIFQAQTATGYNFEVSGGNGGNADNTNAARCLGPGGGGGGGRIMAVAVIPVTPLGISGGNAGMSINSSSCNNGTNGATGGTIGIIETLDTLLSGNIPFSIPVIINQPGAVTACVGETLSFPIETEGVSLSYQWQADDGSGFVNLSNTAPFSGANTAELQISNIDVSIDNYQFRLVISSECFEDVVSQVIPVQVTSIAQANFTFSTDNLTASFSNSSVGADVYLWDFGDNQSSSLENPEHTYADYGSYLVMMIVSNICGQDTAFAEVVFAAPVVAAFSNSNTGGCAPFQIQFTNESTGTYDQLFWEFEGGNPVSSSDENPVVIYDTPGNYNVTLTATGSGGSNTFAVDNLVEILTPPSPSFSWQAIDPLTVSFTNNSQNAINYFWTFGDGDSSTESNPVHEYAAFGDFEVTLNAENTYCGVSFSQEVLLVTSLDDPELLPITLFPNPVEDLLQIKWKQKGYLNIQIFTAGGKLVYENEWQDNKVIDVSRFPSGLYFLKYEDKNVQGQIRFIKM